VQETRAVTVDKNAAVPAVNAAGDDKDETVVGLVVGRDGQDKQSQVDDDEVEDRMDLEQKIVTPCHNKETSIKTSPIPAAAARMQ
jgi:hypothetical protein